MFRINAACPVNVCPFGAFFLQAVRTSVDEATATFGARRAKHAPAIAHSWLNNENGSKTIFTLAIMAASASQFSRHLGIGMFVPLALSLFKPFGLRLMKLQQRLACPVPSMHRQ